MAHLFAPCWGWGVGFFRAAVCETRNLSKSIFREDAAIHCSQKSCGVSPKYGIEKEGHRQEVGV